MTLTKEQLARLTELETISNTRTVSAGNASAQANAVAALFAANGNKVTGAQLRTINPKYPSDPVYYFRKQTGAKVDTVRRKNNADGSLYVLRMTGAQVTELAELKALQAKAVTPDASKPASK